RRLIKESGTDLWEALIECMRDSNTLLDKETIEENVTKDL
ncbi:16428_t:CDS:1, partial [Gigaspora rosea]